MVRYASIILVSQRKSCNEMGPSVSCIDGILSVMCAKVTSQRKSMNIVKLQSSYDIMNSIGCVSKIFLFFELT